jgi:hypothetical protein
MKKEWLGWLTERNPAVNGYNPIGWSDFDFLELTG